MDNFYLSEYFDWRQRGPYWPVRLLNQTLKQLRVPKQVPRRPRTGMMTNIEQRINIYHLALQTLVFSVPGALVEFGCYKGATGVLLRKVIDESGQSRELHLYDSFQGLPAPTSEDGRLPFKRGDFYVAADEVLQSFWRYELTPPIIHSGPFQGLSPDDLPSHICFAHIDGDLFDSTVAALELVYPRMPLHAIAVIDDYCDPEKNSGWNLLPGVKAACDQFFSDKPESVIPLYAGDYSHGYFRKTGVSIDRETDS
jgi:O-methyltransferase